MAGLAFRSSSSESIFRIGKWRSEITSSRGRQLMVERGQNGDFKVY